MKGMEAIARPRRHRHRGSRSSESIADHVEELRSEMIALAEALELERAAKLRDRNVALQKRLDAEPARAARTERKSDVAPKPAGAKKAGGRKRRA
jgi:hypothetical protein